jgi:mannose/cellobiose epimerase-like protein (N-acyl-D-glucosamine 2-epimerase family)
MPFDRTTIQNAACHLAEAGVWVKERSEDPNNASSAATTATGFTRDRAC